MTYKLLLVCVVCTLGSGITRADDHGGCYDDVDACTSKLRALMLDESVFWFGSEYIRNCGTFSTIPGCSNPDPASRSILARLYNASDDTRLQRVAQTNNNLKLAHVRFTTPSGHYYGCGHHFEAPALDHRVDPLTVTAVNSWSLDHVPSITWDGDDSSMYTVVVWDVGVYYLHGLYINARGSNLDSATVLDKYHGPVNTRLRANVFLFAVFKQTGFIDPGLAAGVMGGLMGQNLGALPMAAFITGMGGLVSDMVAANVMTVVGDAYSMERQTKNFILNFCPPLISQSPALKAILNGAGIPSSYTLPKTTLGYTIDPYMSSLTTDLSIEYFMPRDMVVDSCCVKTTFSQSLYRPDPLGTRTTRPALTSSTPRVELSPINIISDRYDSIKNKVYTLLMVDMSDALTQVDKPFFIIHWMVNDIKDADISKGTETLPYLGPNPFNSDAPRTYLFLLLEQKDEKLDTSNVADFVSDKCPDFLRQRCGAQVSRMLQAWNLNEIRGVTWFQAVQDAYARKRLYSELMVKQMVDVCDGQPGYEDPCPDQQFCSGTNRGHTMTFGLGTGIVLALTTLVHYYANSI